jgi:NAD(P)H-hydrate repair Nnr-like enzyme with NAD(P)H-hydrate epimerase domain
MSVLETWTRRVLDELGLGGEMLDPELMLEVAREVAPGVARPAAPLTTNLLGIAVGRGANAADATERLTMLARHWPERASRQ